MNRRKWLWAFLLMIAAAIVTPKASSADLSGGIAGLRLPPKLQLTPVGDEMTVNGLRMQVAYFQADQSLQTLSDEFRHRLGSGRQQQASGWVVLSWRDESRLLSIQLRAHGSVGTQGLIAISDVFEAMRRRRPQPRPEFPLPSGTSLIQVLQANDLGAKSHTVILQSEHSPRDALNFYRSHFRRRGYEPVTHASLGHVRQGGAMVLGRGGELINVAAAERGGSTLIAIVRVLP